MKLVVSGLRRPGDTTTGQSFEHLWGKHVRGFKPWKHCAACLQGSMAAAVTPGMSDGEYELQDSLFYLCGVGQPDRKRESPHTWRRYTNVHLAVVPRQGSVASAGSVYGALFTIHDAQAILIKHLSPGFAGISDERHTGCKNFQFGWQLFDVVETDLADKRLIKQIRPEFRHFKLS